MIFSRVLHYFLAARIKAKRAFAIAYLNLRKIPTVGLPFIFEYWF
jgi:hypothetical protein